MKIQSQNRERAVRKRSAIGFSLIELLIVVAIILIIAAIAIPNFLRAKMAANESSAVSSIHSINTAEIQYASSYPSVGFSPSLITLGPTGSSYIDADPVTRGVTGLRSFYSDQQNVTHYNQTASAAATDPQL